MRAAIKTDNEGEIILQEIDQPKLSSGEVLIKVKYCGICGSDLHAYKHSKGYEFVPKPIVMGHEFSGVVVDVFDASLEHLKGKNVIVEAMNYCGKCENCLIGRKSICTQNKVIGLHFDGGMAQFVKTKALYVREIPNGIPHQLAALCEPMSIAVHAVRQAGEISKTDMILVQGPGIIGFFVSLILAQKGAKVYLSGLEQDYKSRLSKCQTFGVIPHIVESGNLDEKVDIVFECSGSNIAVKSGFRSLKKGGKAVLVALYEHETTLFLTELVRSEILINTSYGSNPEDYDEAFSVLDSLSEKLIDIMTIYPLTEVTQAFEDGLNQEVLKPILAISE
ncbi:zinc-dependent alcohol dehydrogenase [Bacillus sp. FJAT-29937]|uniref:zinc-dependent alcohol dehydrogenase n=1 Tax=Bacillus sp. FJAT-29937 TaxID=1720553 RepID=UPI0008361878|nr:alcohol dehydrogenase catalytic domain-containing protein [Bacillus sp. FJAT-29937]